MSKIKRQMKNPTNFIEKIKLFFLNDNQIETEKFVIAQKSCPHCASRGLFVFKDNSIQISKSTFKFKHSDVTLSSLKDEEQNNEVMLRQTQQDKQPLI